MISQVKLKIKLTQQWNNKSKNYKLLLFDNSIQSMKIKMLKFMKLNFQQPDFYYFYIIHLNCTTILQEESDFYRLLLDYLIEEEKVLEIFIKKTHYIKNHNQKKQQFCPSQNKQSDSQMLLQNKYQSFQEQQIELNRPNYKLYLGEEEVYCKFCKESCSQKQLIQDLGPMYGPVKLGRGKTKSEIYFHELCAIWCNSIYLHPTTHKLINLKQEIKWGGKSICSFNKCGLHGARLGCKVQKCKNLYHYKCAIKEDSGCYLDGENFELFCPNHVENYNDLFYSRLKCSAECNQNFEIVDDQFVLCDGDQCYKGYHIFCLNPPLTEVPDEDWYCPECLLLNKSINSNQNLEEYEKVIQEIDEEIEKEQQQEQNLVQYQEGQKNY